MKTDNQRIMEVVSKSGYSQREVAAMLGMTDQYLSKVINGKTPLTSSFIEKFDKLFPPPRNEAVPVENSNWMEVPMITVEAQAGYLDSLIENSNYEYMNDATTIILPKEMDSGNYIVFEVRGDSMDDGTSRSLRNGDRILCKELQRHHWVNRLHFRQYLFVFVCLDGIVVKQVVDHDTNTGTIRCRSWNEMYDPYDVHVDECLQIFYVKKIVDRPVIF